MDGVIGALWVPLALSCLLREWTALQVLEHAGCHWRAHWPLHACTGLFNVAWMLLAALYGPYVPVLFLGVHLSVSLSGAPYWRASRYGTVYAQVSFLIFAAGFLALMGAAALLGEGGLEWVASTPWLRFLILTAAQFFAAVMGRLSIALQSPGGLEEDRGLGRDRTFSLFLWCCVLYVYADGAFSAVGAGGLLVAGLLAAGNVLLLLLLFLLFQRERLHARDAALRAEHRRLESQRAEERLRTRRLEEDAVRDRLTGAWSRRAAEGLAAPLRAGQSPFSVAYLDLDGLKRVNDAQGHEAGDRLLAAFVGALTARLGREDAVVRVGGDEFLVLLPRLSRAEAEARMGEIRTQLSALEPPLPFSFGAASGPGDLEALVREADRAMYMDKRREREGGGLC